MAFGTQWYFGPNGILDPMAFWTQCHFGLSGFGQNGFGPFVLAPNVDILAFQENSF
jgi:hypothetical protein